MTLVMTLGMMKTMARKINWKIGRRMAGEIWSQPRGVRNRL